MTLNSLLSEFSKLLSLEYILTVGFCHIGEQGLHSWGAAPWH